MKKTILSFLLLSTLAVSSLAAKSSDSEYKIEISDKITIGSSRAYECVATIAHLAGFQVGYTFQSGCLQGRHFLFDDL